MKIQRASSSNKRWILIVVAILLLAGVGAGVYALQQTQQNNESSQNESASKDSEEPKINLDPPTEEEVQAGNEVKEQHVNPSASPSPSSQPSGNLSVTANYTGTGVQVRGNLSLSVQDGSCTLTLTKGSTIVTKSSVGIQPLPGYSTCKGWDVPVSELSSGTWTAKVTATYQSKTDVASADVTIP